ncbi:MAG: 23S rRNA pseudouridine1911/1915/1917 synthase [Myxococcota bacterium]|jgi:23S rRNA pseudouridine1911/1915/1917 synthase
MSSFEHLVSEQSACDRLDRYACRVAGFFASTAQAYLAAKKGTLRLNDEQVSPGRRVKVGDLVTSTTLHGPARRVFELPLEVVFEDQHMAVVDKPPGLLVSGPRHRTVERALPFNLAPSTEADVLSTPRPVHRLDVPTGGLLMVAKTSSAAAALGQMLSERRIEKRYRALVVGRLEGSGRAEGPVAELRAASRYRVVEHTRSLHCGWVSTVDLWPETGRTHQLRRHMADLGHPILGDDRYGQEGAIFRRCGLFLRSVALRFEHPHDGVPVALSVDEPLKYASYRRREARRWSRAHEAP